MGALKLAGLAAAVAALAAVVVLLAARGGSAPAAAPTAPVAVRASFLPASPAFGDPVTARVVVVVDRDAVRADTLRVRSGLAPLTVLGAPSTRRTATGRLETVTITQRAACLTAPCLAPTIALPRVHVSVTRRDGTTATASAPWHRFAVRGRVTAADLRAARPRFAAETTPDAPSYRISPGTAAVVLEVVAALAAAGAAALLVLGAAGLVRRRLPAPTGDELARALRLGREAEERPVPDRRRALALLARLLHGRDGTLGEAASDLAWSRPAPERPAVESLVADVERGSAR